MSSFPRIRPMGESALLVELGEVIDEELNRHVHALALNLAGVGGVRDVIPAYASLLVEFEPDLISHGDVEAVITRALEMTRALKPEHARVIDIPTRYGGEFGPDLDFVAAHNALSPAGVIRLHTSRPWRVFMLGFTPGFPYIGPLPAGIAAPRLDTPRARVPAGSVGIAGFQTGIYPRESPGGWRLIGRTDLVLFDPAADPPVLLHPGDYVRFIEVT